MAKIEGGCLCGAVRYRCEADAAMTAVCHCSHCQKQSGTSFSLVVGVPRDALRLEGAAPKTYADEGDSGEPVDRLFCGDCGSPILTDVKAVPELLFLKSGTLDDRSWLQPTMEIWTEHKQAWVAMPEGLQQAPRNPGHE